MQRSDDSVEFDQDAVMVESVDGLAKQVAQLAKEKEEMRKQVDELAEKMAQMGEEQAREKAKSAEELAKCQKQLKKCQVQLKDVKNATKKLAEEKAEQQGQMEQLEKRMASAEYAHLIDVPIVANLQAHYDKEKLLQLLEHGNTVPSIYIQYDQLLNDPGLIQSIVDLLATVEKPTKLVGEVEIECPYYTAWPKREELKLVDKKSNVAITWNDASANPGITCGWYLAEYELTNRGCHFQVLINYANGSDFDKSVWIFTYRRLP